MKRGAAGALLLTISMTLVNVGNLAFNLILGRALGPAAFSDLALIVTLWLGVMMVCSATQLTTARAIAAVAAVGDHAALRATWRHLARRAWKVGLPLGALWVLGAHWLAATFNVASPWPFAIVGAGIPLCLATAVDRGALQGELRFGALSLSFLAEMAVRSAGAVAVAVVMHSVTAATAALLASFVAARAAAWWATRHLRSGVDERSGVRLPGLDLPVIAMATAEVVIAYSDVLLVKASFSRPDAGRYIALALIARAVFAATWFLVQWMVPVVTQRAARGEPHRGVLRGVLALMAAGSGAAVALTVALPGTILTLAFGASYSSVGGLLPVLVISAMLFGLGLAIVAYDIAVGNHRAALLAVGAAATQVLGLLVWHGSLNQVIVVQVVVMTSFAASAWWVSAAHHRSAGTRRHDVRPSVVLQP